MKFKLKYILFICFLLSVSSLTYVAAVTDAELEALEKQIEQQEAEEKQRADTEAKVEEAARVKKQAKAKARVDAETKRKAEEVEQVKLEKQKQEAEAKVKEKAKEEKKSKYKVLIAEAEQAFNDKDKTQAIKKYNEALALLPGDVVATRGLVNAENLKHKLCYDVLGKWIWDKAFGKDVIILYDSGSLDYQTAIKGSGNWECTSPETRTIKLRLSAAGFSNEWLSTYSADGSCLLGPETWGDRGCYHRPESYDKTVKNKVAENKQETSNVCSEIIGIWRWDDLARTITRFYEDGKVVSKNILKSEGNWECIEPKNRIFTSNTWGKKRDIKMSDDANQLESTNAFTGNKLIGTRISDDPFEKIVPAKNSSSNAPKL